MRKKSLKLSRRRFFTEPFQGFVDKDFWCEVGAQGYIGIETPVEKGGWGGDFLQHVVVTEEQQYARVPGNFLLQVQNIFSTLKKAYFQSDMVMPYVAHFGTDDQGYKIL